ncbi:hypothetical protein ACRAWG_15750 [Methylobacterium sp. P31]
MPDADRLRLEADHLREQVDYVSRVLHAFVNRAGKFDDVRAPRPQHAHRRGGAARGLANFGSFEPIAETEGPAEPDDARAAA